MLIVHPSSTCDVCLDGYNWSTPSHSPHAIACGHVFCLQCLQSLVPSICPLCRKAFRRDKIRKLHIDRLTSSEDLDNTGGAEESEFLQRIALFFGENTPHEDVTAVIEEVNEWLSAREENPTAHRALLSAVAALRRHRELQQETREAKETIEELLNEHRRKLRVKEQDLQTAKAVEDSLLEQLQTMEEDYNAKLADMERELAMLRGEHPSEPTEAAPKSSPNFPNSLPQTSDHSRYQSASNPLPQPPQPVSAERLAVLTRPYTSMSSDSTTASSAPVPASSHNHARSRTGRSSSPAEPSQEYKDDLRRDRALRPPLLVPGAGPTQKVIPPPPSRDRESAVRGPRNDVRHSAPSGSVDVTPVLPAGGSVRSAGAATPAPAAYGYQYGYIPGQGYAWYQVPWPAASSSTASIGASDGPTRSGSNVDIASRSVYSEPVGGSSNSQSSVVVPPQSNGRLEDPAQGRSRRPSLRHDSSASTTSSRDPAPIAAPGQNSNTSTMSGASLSNMALLDPPYASRAASRAQSTDHRDILSLLRASPAPQTSEPSPVSTWGTVRSSQISSRNSTNSSLGDLGLVGLPEAPDDLSGEDDIHREDVSEGESDEAGEDDLMTPRRRPLPYGRGTLPEHSQSAQADSGLGLSLSTNVIPPRQVIRGPQELQIVSQSLLQLASRNGRESRGHGRVTPTFSADSRDAIIGSRTGFPLYSSRPQSRRGDEDRPSVGPMLPSRTHSETLSYHDHASMSDSEHVYSRHGHSMHRRHTSLSGYGTPSAFTPQSAMLRRPSGTPRTSDRHSQNVRFQTPTSADGPSPADRRHHETHHRIPPVSATDANGFVPALGQSSLLLSFSNSTQSTSAAVNGSGEDSGIRAPAPRSVGSQNNSLFGLWNARSGR